MQVDYRIGLVDDAMRGAEAEGIADRVLVRMIAVRADFRHTDDALAEILK
jgi:hypothetical protein